SAPAISSNAFVLSSRPFSLSFLWPQTSDHPFPRPDGRFYPDDGGGDGNPADAASRSKPANACRRAAVYLDDRAAGDDDLFRDVALPPARSRFGEFCRAGEFSLHPDRSRVPRVTAEYLGAGRLGARHHH